MKKMLTVLVVFGLGVALDRMFESVPLTAAAGGGQGGGVEKCSSKNGDVNADGSIDLGDALTILFHLFGGNPLDLLPLCDPPELAACKNELSCSTPGPQCILPDHGWTGVRGHRL